MSPESQREYDSTHGTIPFGPYHSAPSTEWNTKQLIIINSGYIVGKPTMVAYFSCLVFPQM